MFVFLCDKQMHHVISAVVCLWIFVALFKIVCLSKTLWKFMLSWMKRSRSVDLILLSVMHWVECDNAQWKCQCHGQVKAAWADPEISHCSPQRLCFTLQIKSAQCGSACVRPSIPLAHPSTLFLFLTPSLFQSHPSLYSSDSRHVDGGSGLDPPSRLCVCMCVRACLHFFWLDVPCCWHNLPSVAQSIIIQCFLFTWGLPTRQQTQAVSLLSAGM